MGFDELEQIAQKYRKRSLATIFANAFDDAVPETINSSHTLVVGASELDESSERIITYLAEEHGVGINGVFFSFFPGWDHGAARAGLADGSSGDP